MDAGGRQLDDPIAELRTRLGELKAAAPAGRRSTRDIAKMVKWMSHDTVANVIRCDPFPAWEQVRSIARALAITEFADDEEAAEQITTEFHDLWCAAKQAAEGRDARDRCRGWIDSPQDGDTVGTRIAVHGGARDVPPRHNLWIAHQADMGGLLWPKDAEIVLDNKGRFDVYVYEAGSPLRFYIVLLLVPAEVSSRFDQWIDEGSRTGHYPGLRPSPIHHELARVCLRYEHDAP